MGVGGRERGSEKLLQDGYIYPNSDITEWKLVVPNVCISNFMTIPSSMNFLRPMLVLAVKVRLPRLKESQQGTPLQPKLTLAVENSPMKVWS